MINELINYLKTQNTKIAKKVYNYIDSDAISIIINKNIYYFEFTNETFGCAKYPTKQVENYIHRFMKKQGYIYLYDL